MPNGHGHGHGGWGNGDGNDHAYDKIYDYNRQDDWTVLGGRAEQLRVAELERLQAQNAQSEAMLAAQRRVHFLASVGKFIIPRENTWAAHARLVKDDRNDLHFDPQKYVYFDAVIAQKFPQVMQPGFEALRTNLEVIRNDITGFYLKDGSFDPGDEKYAPTIAGIAGALGDALANNAWYKKPFLPHVDAGVANVEAIGAAEMYQYLLRMQDKPGPYATLIDNIKSVVGMESHAWGLPALEDTPFSPHNMAAAAPFQAAFASEQELMQTCAAPEMQERIRQEPRFADTYQQRKATPPPLSPRRV